MVLIKFLFIETFKYICPKAIILHPNPKPKNARSSENPDCGRP